MESASREPKATLKGLPGSMDWPQFSGPAHLLGTAAHTPQQTAGSCRMQAKGAINIIN